jgi:hypothetical protein
MNAQKAVRAACLVILFVLIAGESQYTWALLEEATRRNEEFYIGIPDFPRRVSRELPEPGREERLKVGILDLHPSFATRIEFDDNVKLRQHDNPEDVIFTQAPAAVGEIKLGDHRIEGGYGMEIVEFVKDQEENTVNHFAGGLLELVFGDLTFSIEDGFEKATNRLFSETSTRDTVLHNAVDAMARYDRPKWAAEVGWRHNTIDHDTPEFESNDYNEDVIAVLAGYKILPKTLLLTEFDWGTIYYDVNDRNADHDYIQILGGVRGDPKEAITVIAKAGYQGRWLGDVTGEINQTDFDGVVVLTDLIYRVSESGTARLSYGRTLRTSTFQSNSWYREDKISASYRKRLLKKWYLTPSASWQLSDYPESTTIAGEERRRDDQFWQAGVYLQYKIQDWLWTGVRYNFRKRNSNYDRFDYENNRIVFDITATF